MTTSSPYVPEFADNTQVVRDYMAAFENKDRARFAELVGSPFRFEGPLMTFEERDEFLAATSEMLGSWTCRADDVQLVAQDDRVAVLYNWTMIEPVPQTLPITEWFRVEGGKIVEIRLMFDTAKFTMPCEQAA